MSRIRTKIQRDAEREDIDRRVARALGDAVGTQRVVITPTGADALRLRGIPAIGRGVGGAIIGSNPEREVIR